MCAKRSSSAGLSLKMAHTESASSSPWFDITGSQNKQMSSQLSDLGSQSTTCFDLRMDIDPSVKFASSPN